MTTALAVSAILALGLPQLVNFAAFFLIGIPLFFAPTLALYLVPTGITYSLARTRLSKRVSGSVSVVVLCVCLIASTLFAKFQNEETKSQIEAFHAKSVSKPIPNKPVENFVFFDYLKDADELECSYRCQRILFSGFAKNFAIGDPTNFEPGTINQQVKIVHRIVPISEGCDNTLLPYRGVDSEIDFIGKELEQPGFSSVLPSLEVKGFCFRSDPIDSLDADIVEFRLDEKYAARRATSGRQFSDYYDWSLNHIDELGRVELHARSGDDLILLRRVVWTEYHELAVPLTIRLPTFISIFNQGGWSVHFPQYHNRPGFHSSIKDFVEFDFSVGN